mmetsp:Transcript_19948/g.49519  ORF Transcript_19948/g.49519 Transcript_19948/m.49519 type:complete len:210 (-) Transcript_19948:1215-1844(-)
MWLLLAASPLCGVESFYHVMHCLYTILGVCVRRTNARARPSPLAQASSREHSRCSRYVEGTLSLFEPAVECRHVVLLLLHRCRLGVVPHRRERGERVFDSFEMMQVHETVGDRPDLVPLHLRLRLGRAVHVLLPVYQDDVVAHLHGGGGGDLHVYDRHHLRRARPGNASGGNLVRHVSSCLCSGLVVNPSSPLRDLRGWCGGRALGAYP